MARLQVYAARLAIDRITKRGAVECRAIHCEREDAGRMPRVFRRVSVSHCVLCYC
jgi:hypothetical protein